MIVLIERFEKRHEGCDISLGEGNTLQGPGAMTQAALAGLDRGADVALDDSVQRSKLPVVHLGGGMPEVAQTRGLEVSDGFAE